jgi:hypothetical protein
MGRAGGLLAYYSGTTRGLLGEGRREGLPLNHVLHGSYSGEGRREGLPLNHVLLGDYSGECLPLNHVLHGGYSGATRGRAYRLIMYYYPHALYHFFFSF